MCPLSLSDDVRATLVESALAAREKAYAPYSRYAVGAALLATDGKVYTGCNIENAAYPACICAERTAVVKAVSEGVREFVAIVVATSRGGSPCGECRQFLNEFSPDILVIIVNAAGEIVAEMPLTDLLPRGFRPADLD